MATTFVRHDGHKSYRGENPVHWVLDASTLVLADFFGSCKVKHPSEAVDEENFWGFPLTFAVLPLATRFK